ncbi:uncharacterized protein [Haliotis cracherodii]|uniref:uncharacterized protein n=1 Tax=Haliotis cracherodii TaxID=6455 RepID=UPI0039EC4416
MDNTSAVGFNISDMLPPQEIAAECNAANMSSGCDGHGANQTNHLFDSLQHIIETTFTCCDVLNVFGNAVLLLLIYKATTKMEASGRLLMNQAVADAGMGLSWLVLYGIIYTNPHKNVLQTAILVQRIVIGIFTSESTLSLAMTLFALHIVICNPILYKVHYKPKLITIFMVVSWLVVFGCGSLALAADNVFVLERDNSLLMNVSKQNAWFVCLTVFVHTILPLAIIIIAFTRICLHMRKKENVSNTSASATKLYVRQAKGILVVSITYLVTFIPIWVFDSSHIHFKSDNGVLLFIIGNSLIFLNYVYLVFKLPLFLLAFKSYRRVASQIFCQHLTSGSSSGPSGDRGQLPQRKYKTATNTNHRLDDTGYQRPSADVRSTPIQMDETTEMKGNIGRVNHGFTSTCSLYHGDTARPNGANDDVSSSANDDVSKRPTTAESLSFLLTPGVSHPVAHGLVLKHLMKLVDSLCSSICASITTRVRNSPGGCHLNGCEQRYTPTSCLQLHGDYILERLFLLMLTPPTHNLKLQPPTNRLKLQPPAHRLKLQPPAHRLKLQPPAHRLKLQPPTNRLKLQPPAQHLKLQPPAQHLKLKPSPSYTTPETAASNLPCTRLDLRPRDTTSQASCLTTSTPEARAPPTPEARDSTHTTCAPEARAPPTQPVHLKLENPPSPEARDSSNT